MSFFTCHEQTYGRDKTYIASKSKNISLDNSNQVWFLTNQIKSNAIFFHLWKSCFAATAILFVKRINLCKAFIICMFSCTWFQKKPLASAMKKLFLKIVQNSQKTPVPESFLKKDALGQVLFCQTSGTLLSKISFWIYSDF